MTTTKQSKWDGFTSIGFDLETTGVDVWTDRIVQAALIRVPGSDFAVRRPEPRTWLVDPGVPIPDGAAEIHGITTEKVQAEGTDSGQMLYELTGTLALSMGRGVPIVGMNLSYDLSLLEAENRRHNIPTLADRLGSASRISPIVDVLVLDKYADPYRKGGRKLTRLCEVYGVRHTGAHDAAADALAACRIWPRLMATHAKKFPGQSLSGLHQSQVMWRRDQADSLRAYFDKKGTEHDGVCPEWPLHHRCAPAQALDGAA